SLPKKVKRSFTLTEALDNTAGRNTYTHSDSSLIFSFFCARSLALLSRILFLNLTVSGVTSTSSSSLINSRASSSVRLRGFFIVAVCSFVAERILFAAFTFVMLTVRSEEHTSELQSRFDLVCRLLLEKK